MFLVFVSIFSFWFFSSSSVGLGPENPSNSGSQLPAPIIGWRKSFPALRAWYCCFFPSLPPPCAKPNIKYSYRFGLSCPNAGSTIQQRLFSFALRAGYPHFSFHGLSLPCGELNIDFLSNPSDPGFNFPAPMQSTKKSGVRAGCSYLSLFCPCAALGQARQCRFSLRFDQISSPCEALGIVVLCLFLMIFTLSV